MTAPLSWPAHFSSPVFLLAFALGCALAAAAAAAALSLSRKKGCGVRSVGRSILHAAPADGPPVSFVAPPGEHHRSIPGWEAVLSPPPPPLLIDGGEQDKEEKKKKKKRGRKKKQEAQAGLGSDCCEDAGYRQKERGDWTGPKPETECIYPFSSFSSSTQRRIKQQYDELVKSNRAKALTMAQVGEFANCLIEARNDLQHKSELIQRKFTITKALLFKADRSSFDRLCQQMYKLEAEQKRLEEDAVVYNRLQEQLKLSPAYKTMLEIGARMESKPSSCEDSQSLDSEFSDISFEELLAQEKKDSFWQQRHGKLRTSST